MSDDFSFDDLVKSGYKFLSFKNELKSKIAPSKAFGTAEEVQEMTYRDIDDFVENNRLLNGFFSAFPDYISWSYGTIPNNVDNALWTVFSEYDSFNQKIFNKLLAESDPWISYISNNANGYVVHKSDPFDLADRIFSLEGRGRGERFLSSLPMKSRAQLLSSVLSKAPDAGSFDMLLMRVDDLLNDLLEKSPPEIPTPSTRTVLHFVTVLRSTLTPYETSNNYYVDKLLKKSLKIQDTIKQAQTLEVSEDQNRRLNSLGLLAASSSGDFELFKMGFDASDWLKNNPLYASLSVKGRTPLYMNAIVGANPEICALLAKSGADLFSATLSTSSGNIIYTLTSQIYRYSNDKEASLDIAIKTLVSQKPDLVEKSIKFLRIDLDDKRSMNMEEERALEVALKMEAQLLTSESSPGSPPVRRKL